MNSLDKMEESITDFREGQWWIKELDSLVNLTDDQKRAVAVVHNLLNKIKHSTVLEDYDRLAKLCEKQAQQMVAQLWALNILIPIARGYVKEHYKPNHLTATQCEQAASVVLDTKASTESVAAWEAKIRANERANMVQLLLAIGQRQGAMGLLAHIEDRAQRGEMYFANGEHITGVRATNKEQGK